ncbi:MAG TPA: hypothetical protein VGV39_05355 [Mesorhizobium sp.]|uniref:hypothetical protein n=1 Tax=Mesorhizobium sp. TaxID=1871066 RepID=UPI002DDD5515|nr:hypothetical protein [Mesorhizobium sp.]HEV2502478.1 hypothetical protein [Mesorhizobium sp.]
MAHASDRGHVLLLPTSYYLAGGAFAVAASFLVLSLVSPQALGRLWRARFLLFRFPDTARAVVSLLSFAVFGALIAAGFWGSRDPLSNPLPLAIWTLLWTGMTLAQGVFGNLWSWLNPWYGPWRLVIWLTGTSDDRKCMPPWLGYWPAFLFFLGFAWFELIYPAPDDPSKLAIVAGGYWLLSFMLMLVFGYDCWSSRGEFLSVFFSMLARFSLLERDAAGRLSLCWPGAKLLDASPLLLSAAAFLLLALSSVSFDGLMRTFFWLGLYGVNPLELPGRTAMMGMGSTGLVATFLLLALLFAVAILLGRRLARNRFSFVQLAGLLVWSIVPIALAYHIAHYLTDFLVNGQYALVALSDPLARGWNLFGTAHMPVTAGIAAGADAAWWLWNVQAALIVGGHILAVLVAHVTASRLAPVTSQAALLQVPLTALMVAYTLFGLWLLATPTAG